ncbi:uncharacterized protein LOC131650248 [Vicia villosa]|uniref:uncharacterized protein LOC131650248 n=1 Tax=Vicia villosa TaxID=3911 RepID=UPI00273AD9A1|nr:uncharacterized protein LOC131650248 [Vicia villosa]
MIINGEIEVHIEEQDVSSEKEFWKNALIMYAIGEELSMNAVKRFMLNTWNVVTLPDLYYNEEGYFLVRFRNEEDKTAVLMRGPYTIYKKPILLHEWNPRFTLQDDILRILPIWVMFPQLPLVYWGDRSIGKIASAIGKSLLTDECTAKKLRVSYARVLIEVDVTKELKQHITIRDPTGEKVSQQVEYEWEPPYCNQCNKVGHRCNPKKEITKKVYVQKEPTIAAEKEVPTVVENPVPDPDIQQVEKGKAIAVEETWTIARPAGKNRGTRSSPTRIDCTNRFDILVQGWNQQVWDIKMLENTDQFVHCEAYKENGDFSHYLTSIYAQNQLIHRKKLWEDIQNVGSIINRPWIIIGDYNNVLKITDRIGGNEVQEAEYRDLEQMMENLGLYEHETKGDHFTWFNKQSQGPIYSRIDRALCNSFWFATFPDCVIEVMRSHISDHAPLKVNMVNQHGYVKKKRRFQFLNCVTVREDYMNKLSDSWQQPMGGNPMYKLWRKLIRL